MAQLLNTIYLPILEKVLTRVLKGFKQYTNRYHIEKYSNICLFYNCYVYIFCYVFCYVYNLTKPNEFIYL